jgi:predicted DNA-binding transcriptional regulator AlpA
MSIDENQIPLGAISVEQFCKKYGISDGTFYNLRKKGKGPKTIKIGARRVITNSAALEWEQQMMAETEAVERACHAA